MHKDLEAWLDQVWKEKDRLDVEPDRRILDSPDEVSGKQIVITR